MTTATTTKRKAFGRFSPPPLQRGDTVEVHSARRNATRRRGRVVERCNEGVWVKFKDGFRVLLHPHQIYYAPSAARIRRECNLIRMSRNDQSLRQQLRLPPLLGTSLSERSEFAVSPKFQLSFLEDIGSDLLLGDECDDKFGVGG